MRYISTRGMAPAQDFAQILLAGWRATAGSSCPKPGRSFARRSWRCLPAPRITSSPPREILAHFARQFLHALPNFTPDVDSRLCGLRRRPRSRRWSRSARSSICSSCSTAPRSPSRTSRCRCWAASSPARCRNAAARATVVAATSGDTGSAAIAALGGLAEYRRLRACIRKGRVSEVQRRQMTTAPHANVHNIALEGTFDDAQAIVKALFADNGFRARASISPPSTPSISRASRRRASITSPRRRSSAAPPIFVVPTGNFGDVFAGEAAMRMGLADREARRRHQCQRHHGARAERRRLCAGQRAGHASALDGHSGRQQFRARAVRSLRPRCRLGARCDGRIRAREDARRFRRRFSPPCARAMPPRRATMPKPSQPSRASMRETGRLIDPHTAVALSRRAEKLEADCQPRRGPLHRPSGQIPRCRGAGHRASRRPCPRGLADLYDGAERMSDLPNDRAAVRGFIEDRAGASMNVEITRLSNGLTVVTDPMPAARKRALSASGSTLRRAATKPRP